MSLVLEDVTKAYREPDGRLLPILGVKHFEVKSGEQVVLLGPSGGGKTTLLNVIAGITSPDRGKVIVAGRDITRLHEAVRDRFRAQTIGFVFQTFNLLSAFTALENVQLGMSFAGTRGGTQRARDLLERVGLGHRLGHRPGQLSVGQQQRVAVARALSTRPKLLLADEPTANVDPGNQDTILKLIREASAEDGISLLLVTHAPSVADQFERVETLSNFNKPEIAA